MEKISQQRPVACAPDRPPGAGATRNAEFWAGARDTLPLIIGAIPFGIIFGTLAGGAGLSAAATMGMSLFVFAGSAQFIAVGLVGAGTAWPMIVLTTLVVNFRHLLYTATLLPHLRRLPRRWQVVLAFGLTDETFVVAAGHWADADPGEHKQWYQLGSMAFMYTNWNLCTLVGLLAGRVLQHIGGWGLDFAMVAAFIGMVIPYLTDKPAYATVLVSGACAVTFHGLPYQLGLIIAALVGMAAGVIVERRLRAGH
ncbi:MAG: AzlC family ABC transporter permease [Desulfatitalea sp.]|nr:AzlC family ABC transporter permease [Desulfatitalea sp.]